MWITWAPILARSSGFCFVLTSSITLAICSRAFYLYCTAMLVVESISGHDCSSNAYFNKFPDMVLSFLTLMDFLIAEFSSEESASWVSFPNVYCSILTRSNNTPRHIFGCEWGREASLFQFVEWPTDCFFMWGFWFDWHWLSIFDPISSLESEPNTVVEFEDESFMMPVAIVPGPSLGSESLLRWTPVVPGATIKSVPDFVGAIPFPVNLWHLGCPAPIANSHVTSVFLHECKAFLLGAQDLVVFFCNVCFGLSI